MVGEYYLASLPDRGGRITVEWVAECSWNQWPNHRGLGGRMVAEYAERGIIALTTCKQAPFSAIFTRICTASNSNKILEKLQLVDPT